MCCNIFNCFADILLFYSLRKKSIRNEATRVAQHKPHQASTSHARKTTHVDLSLSLYIYIDMDIDIGIDIDIDKYREREI